MAWTESGLYVATMVQALSTATASTSKADWTAAANKFYLTSSTDTPDFTQVAASAIYSATNEITGGANWPATGLTCSVLATGSGPISPTVTISGKILNWGAGNVSVATTTTTGTGARGGFFYQDPLSPKSKIAGIWFGGLDYSTVAGTFAITWSGALIATITCAV